MTVFFQLYNPATPSSNQPTQRYRDSANSHPSQYPYLPHPPSQYNHNASSPHWQSCYGDPHAVSSIPPESYAAPQPNSVPHQHDHSSWSRHSRMSPFRAFPHLYHRCRSANSDVSLPAQIPGFPLVNRRGCKTCWQCGAAGREKDGLCVEKWGPGPLGRGTVCDRWVKFTIFILSSGSMAAMDILQAYRE